MEKPLVAAFALAAGLGAAAAAQPASAQGYGSGYSGYGYRSGYDYARPVAPSVVHRVAIRPSEDHGAYLTDGSGRALYLFTGDRRGRGSVPAESGCYGPCIKAWPPAYAVAPIGTGGYVDPARLRIIIRADGRRQLTYNGWPLYFYAGDLGAAETQGQDKEEFGGEWYLITPQGTIVRD
jgi:predicted lipoprotein with Yx(FWY)xxD motif